MLIWQASSATSTILRKPRSSDRRRIAGLRSPAAMNTSYAIGYKRTNSRGFPRCPRPSKDSPSLPSGTDPENALILRTTRGDVIVALRNDIAPGHAERLKLLAREQFYDDVPFHRVIDGFMAQTGDGEFGNGTGGSKHPDLQAEFSKVPFKRGVVGMARTGNPHSANSQFFIMFERARSSTASTRWSARSSMAWTWSTSSNGASRRAIPTASLRCRSRPISNSKRPCAWPIARLQSSVARSALPHSALRPKRGRSWISV